MGIVPWLSTWPIIKLDYLLPYGERQELQRKYAYHVNKSVNSLHIKIYTVLQKKVGRDKNYKANSLMDNFNRKEMPDW